MSRRRANAFSDVQYQQLDQTDSNNYADLQFQPQAVQKVPWKAIGLALLLCVGGLVMLIVGSLIVSGHLDTKVSKINFRLKNFQSYQLI